MYSNEEKFRRNSQLIGCEKISTTPSKTYFPNYLFISVLKITYEVTRRRLLRDPQKNILTHSRIILKFSKQMANLSLIQSQIVGFCGSKQPLKSSPGKKKDKILSMEGKCEELDQRWRKTLTKLEMAGRIRHTDHHYFFHNYIVIKSVGKCA